MTDLGASCEVTALNYDHTVALALAEARKNGWEVVQDTAWDKPEPYYT